MKLLVCAHNRSMLMPVFKLPALLCTDSNRLSLQRELERKYGGRMLEKARVFKGKNSFFWTDRIAEILTKGNEDEIPKFQ